VATVKGLRDRAILAVLLGCGLRRSEVAALTFAHVQQRDGRWCIVDLVGKHGRVRTAPMPNWVKVAIDAWTSAAVVANGRVFRPVNRADQAGGEVLSEKVVWQLIKPYAETAGVPGIAPHDLRRTCAKLCRAGGGELEQIQLLLGHASVQTTGLGTESPEKRSPFFIDSLRPYRSFSDSALSSHACLRRQLLHEPIPLTGCRIHYSASMG
jgi:integrase